MPKKNYNVKPRDRALISASVLIMLLTGVLTGATYALFTSTAKVSNHLQAGNLNISLLRTGLTKKTLNASGMLEEKSDSTVTDFSGTESANIFGLEDRELIVPMSSFSANLRIMNGKKSGDSYIPSSVAFDYSVSIVIDEASSSDLTSQLTVTVKQGDTTSSKHLSEYSSDSILTGSMKKTDEYSDFTITLSFDDLDASINNKAQDASASFDLCVTAVQKVS